MLSLNSEQIFLSAKVSNPFFVNNLGFEKTYPQALPSTLSVVIIALKGTLWR